MSTNTTIPIDWDNQQDNALFGSLFPGGFRNQKNESNDLNSVFNEKSVFTNSPFGQYWDINIHEWAKPIFGSAKILDKKSIVIADKSSKISHNQADYYNAIIQDGISKYNFVVYSDSDGEKVLKWYNDKNNVPNKNKPLEVLIFIETDDGKFDFGKIVRVKFGPAVLDDLKDKYFKELPWKDNDPEDIAEEFLKRAWATSVSSKTINAVEKEKNTSDFNDLLIKAIQYEYDNEKFDDFSWFIVMLKGTEFVGLNLPNWCFSTGQWFRDRKYIEDKFWNGDLPEKEYTPAFMPNSVFYDTKEDRSRAIKQMFNENYNYLIQKVNENITKENYISEKTKTFLLDKILECNEISSLFVDKFLSEINISDGWFQLYAKHYNAFIVGLHNGLLEFIAGICDLTAIVILHCRQELGFRMTDMLSEKFENFLNDLLHNTLETLKKIWTKTIEIFKDFAKWYQQFSEYDGKSYKIIKEIAELIPDILTFVIPVLKGSKAAKLAKAGEEVAVLAEKQAAKETIEELTEAEAKIIAQTAKEAIENGTATKATKEAVEKVENEIIEKTPTQLEEVVVKKKKKKLFKTLNFKLQKMKVRYVGEETGKGWCTPKKVRYLDEIERLEYRLTIKDGKVYDNKGKLFDTSDTNTLFGVERAIFVMDDQGQIFASTSHSVGEFHHSSFLSGKPVASAGELKITNGVINEISRKSGHYQPSLDINQQIINHLKNYGVEIKNIKILDGF